MKKRLLYALFAFSACCLAAKAQNPVVAPVQIKPVILSGGIIHTGTGEVIENGLVAFSGGKLLFVGKTADFKGDRTNSEARVE